MFFFADTEKQTSRKYNKLNHFMKKFIRITTFYVFTLFSIFTSLNSYAQCRCQDFAAITEAYQRSDIYKKATNAANETAVKGALKELLTKVFRGGAAPLTVIIGVLYPTDTSRGQEAPPPVSMYAADLRDLIDYANGKMQMNRKQLKDKIDHLQQMQKIIFDKRLFGNSISTCKCYAQLSELTNTIEITAYSITN